MDFSIPGAFAEDIGRFREFLGTRLKPRVSQWYREGEVPRDLFRELGREGWLGFERRDGTYVDQPAVKQALMIEELGKLSPGLGVAVLVHVSLGTKGLFLFGPDAVRNAHMDAAVRGDSLFCLGNTEATAGSDVAAVATRAEKTDGGWVVNGTKSFVTNGAISDYALVTAVADEKADRNRRLSMFLVDLSSEGVSRTKLNKKVWIPSDLTRLQFRNVFVPEANLVGLPGRGLQQVLEIFTNSRLTIGALTLGTALGAFELGLDHASKREVFGTKVADLQAKSFEIADFHARIEAARLVLLRACWAKDQRMDFRLDASVAKYLTVEVARAVSTWAADLFGASSVVFEHPVHKFPMDAWASSLGEGTQDVQKLIIFREVMKRRNGR